MKKLLLILLCLLCITGCSDETPKQEQPPIKQEEKVEEKYLTVEVEVEKIKEEDSDRFIPRIKDIKVINDEQNIFKNMSSEELLNWLIKENDCNHPDGCTYSCVSKLDKLVEPYNLAGVSNYKHELNDSIKNITTIIFKSKDEIDSYDEKINLNDNIVVSNTVEKYAQYNDKCANAVLKSWPYDYYLLGDSTLRELGYSEATQCYTNIEQNKVDILNEIKWFKSIDQNSKSIIVSQLVPQGPWFDVDVMAQYKDIVEKAHLAHDDDGTIDYYSKYNQEKYFILDEQACEEYNLVCDRW
ncbi:MAG: hypothetical protein K2G03_07420 [Bacilli bacterium]|nr:hypothetical protein [Bacilli bacterium]